MTNCFYPYISWIVGSNVNGSASSDATGDHAEDPSLKLETKLKTRVQRSKSFPHEESQIVELKLMPSFNEQEKEPAVEVCVSLHCLILLCRSF